MENNYYIKKCFLIRLEDITSKPKKPDWPQQHIILTDIMDKQHAADIRDISCCREIGRDIDHYLAHKIKTED